MIWRNALWYKLDKNGIYKQSRIYKIIVSMYDNVKSCVFCNNEKSDYFVSLTGVKQGENLSTFLFTLLNNDLEDYLLCNDNSYLSFNDDMCNNYLKDLLLLYADDTLILKNS